MCLASIDSDTQKEPVPDVSSLGPVSEGAPYAMFDHQPAIGRIRNTLEETNKYSLSRDSRLHRMLRDLRERFARPGRIVYGQVMRGAAYGVGSGAVSLLIMWWQNHH